MGARRSVTVGDDAVRGAVGGAVLAAAARADGRRGGTVTQPGPSPDFATVLDWVEGRLDEATAAAVAEAAVHDRRVREIVAWLRGFHEAAAALPLVDPPPIVDQRLRQYFIRRSRARVELNREPVQVVARMLFDSRQDVALVDLRSADDVDELAHLAFTSDVADVVLDVRRLGPGRVRIEGQVLPSDEVDRAFAVEATGPRMSPVHSVTSDGRGTFRLAELPDRVDKLRMDSDELVVLVQLDVGWSRL
jgi:hypothetical protein